MADRWAAGVLPVAVREGGRGQPVPVILLGLDARDKGGKWSDFAGGGEECDPSPRHTALRELDEETGGVVRLTLADLEASLLELRDVTPSGKSLHRYVVRVPYDADLPSRFTGAKDDEKAALAWFPLDALPPLRRVFAQQMRRDGASIARLAAPLDV